MKRPPESGNPDLRDASPGDSYKAPRSYTKVQVRRGTCKDPTKLSQELNFFDRDRRIPNW